MLIYLGSMANPSVPDTSHDHQQDLKPCVKRRRELQLSRLTVNQWRKLGGRKGAIAPPPKKNFTKIIYLARFHFEK
jgi:hypothetical protein